MKFVLIINHKVHSSKLIQLKQHGIPEEKKKVATLDTKLHLKVATSLFLQ